MRAVVGQGHGQGAPHANRAIITSTPPPFFLSKNTPAGGQRLNLLRRMAQRCYI